MTTSCLFDWAQPSVHPSNGPTDTEANAVTAVKNDGSPQLATGRPTRSPLSRPRNHETSAQITWQAWNAFYRVETTVQPEEYRDDTEFSRIKNSSQSVAQVVFSSCPVQTTRAAAVTKSRPCPAAANVATSCPSVDPG